MALLLLDAERRAIDISRPPGAQQQTCRTLLQRSIDGTDGRRDGLNFFSPTPAVVSPAVVLLPHNIVLICLQLVAVPVIPVSSDIRSSWNVMM